jgi:nucleotide-binding universal stress UspA family protein
MKNILLAVDGSLYTKHMLAFLATHPDLLSRDVHYTVLTAVPSVPPRAAAFFSTTELAAYYADEVGKVQAPVKAFLAQQGWHFDCRHEAGHAGDVIAETATSGRYDLVVLGSHGHSALGSLVLGSVAARVLAKCVTPVLLVRQ